MIDLVNYLTKLADYMEYLSEMDEVSMDDGINIKTIRR
jgi:hypothetical protein